MPSRYWGRVPHLLREAPFRRYWTGQTMSLFGDQITTLALPLTAVLVLHASPAAMGLLSAAGLMPALLFSIHAGAWVDRRGRRRHLMIVADVARAVLLLCIPAAFSLGLLDLPALLAIAFLVGTLTVLFRVSSSTLFVSLVPRERYIEAISLLTGSRAVAWLTGPGIGGLLVQLFSAPVALLADALSFIASALSLGRIHPEEPPPDRAQQGHTTAGLRFIWRSPVLRASLSATATLNFFHSVFFALYVLYATRSLRLSPAELGIILGPGSIGALLGSAVAGRVSRRVGLGRTLMIGTILYPAPLVLVPLAGGPHLIVLAILFLAECLSGMGAMVLDITNGTVRAAAIPDNIRARVMGAFQFAGMGIRPLGALLGGAVATVVGVHATLWVATLGGYLAVLWLLPSPIRHLRDVEDFLPREPAQVSPATSG